MELEEFSIKLKSKIDFNLSDIQINQFYNYMTLLQEWNEKINLTAIIEPNSIILKHFVDSMTILNYIEENDKIVDIGTGAGFPGIPIKIVKKNSKIILLDSLNKRINFLNDVIDKIKLKDIQSIHGRAEEFGKSQKYREKFDIAVSRAVAPMNVLLEYLLPTVKIGGKCICMKGPEIEKELEECKSALKVLGGEIEKIEKIDLENNKRNIILVKKINKTPNKYPRNAGIPSKAPILSVPQSTK